MNKFIAFFKKPYSDDMSAFDWFLFIGLLILISAGWGVILRHITEA